MNSSVSLGLDIVIKVNCDIKTELITVLIKGSKIKIRW